MIIKKIIYLWGDKRQNNVSLSKNTKATLKTNIFDNKLKQVNKKNH